MMEERRCIAFLRHFAASMLVLTGRIIVTAGEFGTYLLWKEIPILVAHESSTFIHFEITVSVPSIR